METILETPKKRTQGMNWISKPSRLAIYMRDGLACAYCGSGVEDGATLTLDHLLPYSQFGTNHPTNLVTCCKKCNETRKTSSYQEFAFNTATYLNDVTGEDIILHIHQCVARPIDRKAAVKLIERRGSWTNALKSNSYDH